EPWLEPLPPTIDAEDDTVFARIQSTYAAAVAQLDARLGQIVADCAEHGWDDAHWIITGRRGLPLGEHGRAGFPAALFEELVHVPPNVVWANGRPAGRRVTALTQPIALA